MTITSNVRTLGGENFGIARVSYRGHLSAAAFLFLWSGTACLAYGAPGDTQLVSVSALTDKAAGYSSDALGTNVSYGGRYVVFQSSAKNLIPGASSQFSDIYVRDRRTSSTERVSVALNGAQTNGDSLDASISANGRYVAFASAASNLAPDNDPGRFGTDIFVRDRLTGTTELVSVNSSGKQANMQSQAPAISSDGRYVVFSSYATNLVPGIDNGWANVFVHDRQTGLTEWVSVGLNGEQPDNGSQNGVGPRAISADGRYITFWSEATNLVAGDTNGVGDIFVRDRQTKQTSRVSIDSSGAQANGASGDPGLSADGRFVVFQSVATNLAPGDTNGLGDIFVRDTQTGQTERINVDSVIASSSFGAQRPAMSADARFIAFDSQVGGRYNVYAYDRQTGKTQQVSVSSRGVSGNDQSYDSGISADGRYVVFGSLATNLVSNDHNHGIYGSGSDMYIHELSW